MGIRHLFFPSCTNYIYAVKRNSYYEATIQQNNVDFVGSIIHTPRTDNKHMIALHCYTILKQNLQRGADFNFSRPKCTPSALILYISLALHFSVFQPLPCILRAVRFLLRCTQLSLKLHLIFHTWE